MNLDFEDPANWKPRQLGFEKDTEHSNILRETTNLGVWIARAKEAGVDFVPAMEFGRFSTEQLIKVPDGNADEATLKSIKRAKALFYDLCEWHTKKVMWRWDCCASSSTKFEAGIGASIDDIIKANHSDLLLVDDPRFYDILYSGFAAGIEDVGVYIRPWVTPLMVGLYPVEIRVFSEPKKGVMAANYYIQRPLPELYRPVCEQVMILAKKMAPLISCSMDFVVTFTGEIKFLEGGPGWEHGAHPCSLNPNEPFKDGTISLKPEWDWQ